MIDAQVAHPMSPEDVAALLKRIAGVLRWS